MWVFKGPMGRYTATTLSSLSLTTNKNVLSDCPRKTAQIAEMCVQDSMLELLSGYKQILFPRQIHQLLGLSVLDSELVVC